ncbi:MAG: hypothetical protein A2161_01030 [Candidatus Schekmanbacteria bacterium RBG_13_48_7]|uniref:Uncharacterized protein n=1 Tax=Candidatus Schekmanbacteria bacterium RBG_13_48_7 TaxID=1817878 RepID=A0A1F7S150_9BACT|nr:MAG: hypothetical protein A2161_01030 [Candidatus Schekmanbacteria bacterium RBG_13_48_7]
MLDRVRIQLSSLIYLQFEHRSRKSRLSNGYIYNLYQSNFEGPSLDCKSDLFDIYEFHDYGRACIGIEHKCCKQYADAEREIRYEGWDSMPDRKAFAFSSDNCPSDYHCNMGGIKDNLINILKEANKIQRIPSPMYLPYIGSFAHTEYMDAYCENCNSGMGPETFGINCVVNNDEAKRVLINTVTNVRD